VTHVCSFVICRFQNVNRLGGWGGRLGRKGEGGSCMADNVRMPGWLKNAECQEGKRIKTKLSERGGGIFRGNNLKGEQ